MSYAHKSIARFIPTKLEFLSELSTDTSNDELIKHLLRAATQDAEKFCDCRLYQRDDPLVEFASGNATKTLYLRNCSARIPLVNLTLILYSISSSGVPTLIPAADYEVDQNGYIYYRAGTFAQGVRNYKLSYNPGWYVDRWQTALLNDSGWAVPEDIETATREVAGWHYKRGFGDKGTANLGRISYSTQDASVSFEMIIKKFLPSLEGTFRDYKRIPRPG